MRRGSVWKTKDWWRAGRESERACGFRRLQWRCADTISSGRRLKRRRLGSLPEKSSPSEREEIQRLAGQLDALNSLVVPDSTSTERLFFRDPRVSPPLPHADRAMHGMRGVVPGDREEPDPGIQLAVRYVAPQPATSSELAFRACCRPGDRRCGRGRSCHAPPYAVQDERGHASDGIRGEQQPGSAGRLRRTSAAEDITNRKIARPSPGIERKAIDRHAILN